MKNIKRVAASVAGITAIAGIFVIAAPTIAQADPGRCGVSVEGPANSGSQWAYFVRNDCSSNIQVKVHLYNLDKDTSCHWIVPGETVALFSNYIDNNWQAVAC
ncbi:hypothetical protein [Nocardia colli]|uniref:hypothetical protein n=1 Tax=Nocardia colli TaxID=2545717 RepID=UPI00168D3AA9|nr:hypothetical protein [Nocardia colli]